MTEVLDRVSGYGEKVATLMIPLMENSSRADLMVKRNARGLCTHLRSIQRVFIQ